MVNSLVMCKQLLKLENNDLISDLIEMLWKTLDYTNIWEEIQNGGRAVFGRFNFMQEELCGFFDKDMLTRQQVKEVLDYVKRTLFAHLGLFMTCLSNKQ